MPSSCAISHSGCEFSRQEGRKAGTKQPAKASETSSKARSCLHCSAETHGGFWRKAKDADTSDLQQVFGEALEWMKQQKSGLLKDYPLVPPSDPEIQRLLRRQLRPGAPEHQQTKLSGKAMRTRNAAKT